MQFETANYIEAGLWAVIGIGFLVYAVRPRSSRRAAAPAAAATLMAFAVSDIVEAQTGAWWRPWWLLAWKGFCIAMLIALLTRYLVSRCTSPRSSATVSDRPGAG